MSSIVTLNEDYTQAAIALFGNTKPFLSEIKNIGGIFNARLKYNGSTAPGWIFPKTKLQGVRQLVNKINSGDIKPQEETSDDKKKERTNDRIEKNEKNEKSDKNVTLSREEFMYIMNTLTKLDREVTELKRKINPDSVEVRRPQTAYPKKVVKEEVSEEEDDEEDMDDEDEEEEEVVQPKKGPSFLRKK